MEPVFVDESVFLEFLCGAEKALFEKARELFQRAEGGKIRLESTGLVLAGVARALESRLGRKEVKEVLEAILGTRNLKVPDREVLAAAVEIYGSGKNDFPDAYHIAWLRAKGRRRVATFERKKYREGEGLEFQWKG